MRTGNMKQVSGIRTLCTAALAGFAAIAAFGADTPTPEEFGCEDARDIVAKGGKLEPGKRYIGWEACKTYADANGIPVLFLWSNKGCVHCRYTDLVFTEENYADYMGYKDFKDWAAKNDAGKVIYCYMAGGEKKYPDQEKSEAYNWMWYKGGTKLKSFPFVVLWWEKKGVNVRLTGDAFCSGDATGKKFNASTNLDMDSLPDRLPNVIEKMEKAFAGWSPVPPYAGGYFSQTNAPYASLQAEPTTTNVVVEIVRNSLVATNQAMTVENSQANAADTIRVDWALNQLTQTVAIANFDKKYFKVGTTVTLQLLDGEKVMSTAEIACCPAENSPTVPKWIGETLDVGEWTMDYEAAQDLVKNKKADYLIACVQGSQWCPDCHNVEKNFLGVTNKDGQNAFCAWAKEKKIALVTIDIPNYKTGNHDGLESPCLLKRQAFLSAPEGGEKLPHSGLGYLTRKMVSDEAAAEVLARNHTLVSTMTNEGGFNRPEERDYAGRAYRTGAPVFVLMSANRQLMDAPLKVRAELVRLAEDSPKDAANFANYMKRFEEMLDIATNEYGEIENNYASPEGSVAFKANGGTASNRLCNADMYDTFRLDVSGNAKQTVTVKGDTNRGFDADCKVTVSFQRLGADGKAETVGTPASGTLKDGVTVTETLPTAGDYYVQVRGWGPLQDATARNAGYNSDAFKVTSATDGHFQCYTIIGSGTVLKPGEDKAVAYAASNTNTVEIDLIEGEIYRIDGLKACAALTETNGFYIATASGPAVVELNSNGGKFAYQLWHPGTVGFDILEMDVEKGVCDLDGVPLAIPFSRMGGKSGKVTVQIAITNLASKLYSEKHIWLTNGTDRAVSELVWEDGEEGTKDLLIWIEDSVSWPDFYSVVDFVVTNVTGEASGAACREDEDVFSLGVWYEFEGDVGEAHLTDSGAKIYVREGESAVFYAERSGGRRGLLEVALVSSVEGVTFETENPRDLGTFAEEYPDLAKKYPKYADATLLWWSSGEEGVKGVKVSGVPAGETAKISFIPLNADNTGFLRTESISITSVSSDAPAFATDRLDTSCYRYVAFDESQAIEIEGLKGGDVTFKKLSGKLPSGLKVAFDEESKSFVITGSTTAKSGTYDSVWRVSETRSRTRIDGDTAAIRITVKDVTKEGGGEKGDQPLNPTVAKSRTFKSIPVYDSKNARLVGTLKLTIPTTGKVSGKLTALGGSASVKAKSWNLCNAEGTLQAELSDTKGTCTMTVEAAADGKVAAVAITGFGLTSATAVADANVWSKTNPATGWVGNYTVALKHRQVISEDAEGIAPTGYGYLTLQMKESAAKSGTVKVAGVLPNGSKVSGSYVLVHQIADKSEENVAYLPIFKVASKEAVGLLAAIQAQDEDSSLRQYVYSPEECDGYWKHTEKPAAKKSYEVGFLLCGGYYDEDEDLGGCCADDYETTNFVFYAYATSTPLANIKVGTDTISIDGPNPYNLKLSFKRSTGVVTGSFKDGKDTIKHFGVVVNGWGEGCCSPYTPISETLPFVSGSCTGKKIVPQEVTIAVEKVN